MTDSPRIEESDADEPRERRTPDPAEEVADATLELFAKQTAIAEEQIRIDERQDAFARKQNRLAFYQLLVILTQTLVIALGLYVSHSGQQANERASRLDYRRSVFDAWLEVNRYLASHEELLDEVGISDRDPVDGLTREERRRQLVGFLRLNPLNSIYYGMETGIFDHGPREWELFERELGAVLEDDVVYRLTQQAFYEAPFAEYCRELKLRQAAREQ